MVHVFSDGKGVQSTAIKMLIKEGRLPMPDLSVFADTQGEPASVYDYAAVIDKACGFSSETVTQGNLLAWDLKVRTSKNSGQLYRKAGIPAFTRNADGSKGRLKRYCTREFKIEPVQRMVRAFVKQRFGFTQADLDAQEQPVVCMWMGISTDEWVRCEESRKPWIVNRWPLMDLGMSRTDCLEYLHKLGLPRPPRSACYYCPNRSDTGWLRMQRDEPEEFARAVKAERALQKAQEAVPRLDSVPFLHDSRVPLDKVVFRPQKGEPDFWGCSEKGEYEGCGL